MEVGTGAALTVVGLLFLCFGGYALVSGGVAIAKKFRISSLLIGLTIVAYGTSTPELAVSVASAFQGETNLILGNVIGSNIANIGMVIGISAIATPLLITKGRLIMDQNTIKIWIPIMLGVSALLIIVTIIDKNNISRETGYLFIAILIVLSFFTFYRAKKQRQGKEPEIDVIKKKEEVGLLPKDNLPKWKEYGEKIGYYETVERKIDKLPPIVLIIIGAVALCGGGMLTINGSIGIAEGLGISTTVIGIVIVAIGTSLPELITSIIALRKGQASIGIGNIIGSNIYNILLILGVSSIIADNLSTASLFGPTQAQNLVPNDFVLMIVFSGIILLFLLWNKIPFIIKWRGKKNVGTIPWGGGIILVIMYTIYLIRTSLGFA
jgi:cation:H+ antiporter